MSKLFRIAGDIGKRRASAIFLHGLGGDPYGTWRSGPGDQAFWPRWLADDVNGLAVWSIGYEAPVSRWRGSAARRSSNRTTDVACHSLPRGVRIARRFSSAAMVRTLVCPALRTSAM